MHDAGVEFVETVLDDLVNSSRKKFPPGILDFRRTLLNCFAVGVVRNVAPADEAGRMPFATIRMDPFASLTTIFRFYDHAGGAV